MKPIKSLCKVIRFNKAQFKTIYFNIQFSFVLKNNESRVTYVFKNAPLFIKLLVVQISRRRVAHLKRRVKA